MTKLQKNRIEASGVPVEDLDRLLATMSAPQHPALVSSDGVATELPQTVFEAILKMLQLMREGRSFLLMPEDEPFTTQAAADVLGVSRQFLVNLLEAGDIPHHRTGTHRRVYYTDLMTYAETRQKTRRSRLSDLTKRLKKDGVYGAEVEGVDAG